MRTVREIEAIALKARKRIGLLSGSFHETQLRKRLEDSGFFLFYYPFGEKGISGAVFNSDSVKVLVINSSKAIGRQNFTVAHELGHIFLHNIENMVEFPVDESSNKEKEADRFASFFLMPSDDVTAIVQTDGGIVFDAVETMEISQVFRMSYSGTLARLKEIFGASSIPSLLWQKKPVQLATMLNMDKRLYEPTNEKYWSTNKYVSAAYKALEKERISFSKFLELMREIGLDGYEVLDNMRETD